MDPQNYDVANSYFQRGLAKAELGRYEDAIADWDEVIRLYPDAYTYDNRGLAKANLGRYEEAIADYDEAIRINPTDAVAYDRRGVAKAELGRYEEAIADYDEAIRINPTDAVAYDRRGIAKAGLGRYQDAIADHDEVIRINPTDAIAYSIRGSAKAGLGRYEDAIADHDEAIRLKSDYDIAYDRRGSAKAGLGRYEDAIADYDEAIRLNPTDAIAYNNRGWAKIQIGRHEDAIFDCDEAIRLEPTYVIAYKNRGWAKAQLDRYEDAIFDCDEAIRLDSTDAIAYNNRGWAKIQIGRHEDAIFDCDEAIRLEQTYAIAYNNRGWAKAQLGRHEDAITDYNEAIRLAPGLDSAYHRRSEAEEKLGRYPEASENHDQNLQIDGRSSSISQPSVPSSIIERPNQEALTKALNAYRDVMRRFILDNLLQSYSANRLMDAITTALGDEQVANFERDLSRNGGNVEATLGVNHISSIVRHHWDEIFFAKFGHDQIMLGTLGWVTRARNDAAHPGTADISPEDTNDHFNNIIKVLDRIGAVEEVRVVEEVRKQLNAPSQDALTGSYSTQTAIAHSICANIRCQIVNQYQHPINWDGVASVQCPKCLKQYFVQTCTVVSDDRQNTHTAITHALRVRFPNGEDRIMEFYHSLQIPMERKDKLTISYDRDENLVYLVNENLRQWWYFPIGIKPKRPWWRTTSGPHYTGCYSALSRIIANSFYDPRANFWDRFMNRPFAHVLMAVSGHSKIPLTGVIGQ